MSTTRLELPEGYEPFLKDLKERIRTAQVGAALAVNRELVLLYWSIGRDVLTRQRQDGWRAKIIDRLAADLHKAFPEMTGLSPRNLKYMRALAEAYPNQQFVQQVVAQISWGHNVRILDCVNSSTEREWYIRQTIQNGWSRNVLVHQIESGLYRRRLTERSKPYLPSVKKLGERRCSGPKCPTSPCMGYATGSGRDSAWEEWQTTSLR